MQSDEGWTPRGDRRCRRKAQFVARPAHVGRYGQRHRQGFHSVIFSRNPIQRFDQKGIEDQE